MDVNIEELRKELSELGWSYRTLAKKADLNNRTIERLFQNGRTSNSSYAAIKKAIADSKNQNFREKRLAIAYIENDPHNAAGFQRELEKKLDVKYFQGVDPALTYLDTIPSIDGILLDMMMHRPNQGFHEFEEELMGLAILNKQKRFIVENRILVMIHSGHSNLPLVHEKAVSIVGEGVRIIGKPSVGRRHLPDVVISLIHEFRLSSS